MSVLFLHPLAFFAVILVALAQGAAPLYLLPLHSIPAPFLSSQELGFQLDGVA